MLEENTSNDPLELTADEQAYFDNGGQEPEARESGPPEPEETASTPDAGGNEADDDDNGDDELPDQGKRPGFVPHRKFHKALEKAKKIEADLAKEREERVRLEERTNLILQRFQQVQQPSQKQEPPPPPNPEEDIFGAVSYTGQRVQTIEEKIAAFERSQAEEQRRRAVIQAASAGEREFINEAPDYPDALNHLRSSRLAELQILGMTEAQARQHVGNEEVQFAAYALQRGQNPARLAYQWAVQRGYAKKPSESPDQTPSEKLARQAEAKARSSTLSHGGGAAAPVALDARTVAKMSEDEFAALMAKNPKELDKLMMG